MYIEAKLSIPSGQSVTVIVECHIDADIPQLFVRVGKEIDAAIHADNFTPEVKVVRIILKG